MKIFKTIFLSIFFLNTTFSFSQDMTKNALALIDSFFDLRMNLSLIEESETDKINSEIDSFAVKNKDKITADVTKKISKNVFTKLKLFLTIGWKTLIKYSPGTIATLAVTDKETAKAKSAVPNTTKNQLVK